MSPAPSKPSGCSEPLEVEWLGTRSYEQSLRFQEEAVRARLSGARGDRLLLLEHDPVVTLGRSSDRSHLRRDESELHALGIDVFEVSRGGDVTYHAPGQLVGYPVLDLKALERCDAHDHLRRIESGLIEALAGLGIPCCRVEGRTGVFIDRSRSPRSDGPDRKIASIGVGLRRWVTFHGFALNVTIDLKGFDVIVPCGLADVEMTSVERELSWAFESDRPSGGGSLNPSVREELNPHAGDALDQRVRRCVAESLTTVFRR